MKVISQAKKRIHHYYIFTKKKKGFQDKIKYQ